MTGVLGRLMLSDPPHDIDAVQSGIDIINLLLLPSEA